jgi:hypothetical protein
MLKRKSTVSIKNKKLIRKHADQLKDLERRLNRLEKIGKLWQTKKLQSKI